MAALVETMFSVKATPWHQSRGMSFMEAPPDTEGGYGTFQGLNWKVGVDP